MSNLCRALLTPLGTLVLLFVGCGGNSFDTRVPSANTQIVTIGEVISAPSNMVPQSSIAELNSALSQLPAVKSSPETSTQERWSDPKTWGGVMPPKGSKVYIPSGKSILLDLPSVDLGVLVIDGQLSIEDAQGISISADHIIVRGSLRAGSKNRPRVNRLSISLYGDNNEALSGMGTRGIFVDGGELTLVGTSPELPWTRLTDHYDKTSRKIKVPTKLGWKIGDTVVVGPTDFYNVHESEFRTISSMAPDEVELNTPLKTSRYGRLQTLENGQLVETTSPLLPQPNDSSAPTHLDQRAPVANLSRSIKIASVDDNRWRNDGYGAQVMIMGPASGLVLSGVEFRRMGQAGLKGRYPIHFHQLSYDATGNEIPNQFARLVNDVTVTESSNRCITIHGTNDVVINRNVCFDIKGHAIFLEDAVEKRNVITNNLVLKVRIPPKRFDESDGPGFLRGPTGFWISNPLNFVVGNHSADTEGTGFWLAFPRTPLGINKLVKTIPDRAKFGSFDFNTSHSNLSTGIHFDAAPINDLGVTKENTYIPTSNGSEDSYDNRISFKMQGNALWKNAEGGFWNRVSLGHYLNWVVADNGFSSFFGSNGGSITKNLLVGISNNKATTWDLLSAKKPPVGFATYNSSAEITDNIIVNFPFVDGSSSGAFRTDDYYIHPVDIGTFRNARNTLINSNPGYRSSTAPGEDWALAGALWDPHGYWGAANNYWVYDRPFFTAGQSCTQVQPAGKNGASCASRYFGVRPTLVDGSPRGIPLMGLNVARLDDSGMTIDTWNVSESSLGKKFSYMRHFAAVKNGKYILRYTNLITKNEAVIEIENMLQPEDTFVLAVPFSGKIQAKAYANSLWHYDWEPSDSRQKIQMSAVHSLAEVETSTGDKFWQDTANDLVWVKVKAPYFPTILNPDVNGYWHNIYRPFFIRVSQ
jgi:hypothetical protein